MGLFRSTPYSAKHSSAGRLWGFSRIKGAEDGKELVYMTRLWLGRLRFHAFHRGDQDPDCHDHPWCFWTFPLVSYREEVLVRRRETIAERMVGMGPLGEPIYEMEPRKPVRFDRVERVVKAFRLHYRPACFKHRVLGPEVQGRTVFTIVWRGSASRPWGFTKDRNGVWCWVPWQKYVYEGGKDAPCSETNYD
jgi:hypothetical protein